VSGRIAAEGYLFGQLVGEFSVPQMGKRAVVGGLHKGGVLGVVGRVAAEHFDFCCSVKR